MKFLFDQSGLKIELEGTEILWAARRRLVIPKQSITAITWNDVFKNDERLLRLRGTGITRVLSAGTFVGKKERVFLYLKGARGLSRQTTNVISIATRNFPFLKVLVSGDRETADRLISWLGNT